MVGTTTDARTKTIHVLVADVPQGIRTLEKVLGERGAVVGAGSLEEAVSLLSSAVDLVVCGVHFDESRMYDLLRMAKSNPSTREVPFVCFRDIDSELGAPILQGLEIACSALGAARFVDLHQLKQRHGIADADARFRELLLSFGARS